jgi:hypothetical protein
VDLYGHLLEIGGGKERMTKYFNVSQAAVLSLAMAPAQRVNTAGGPGWIKTVLASHPPAAVAGGLSAGTA